MMERAFSNDLYPWGGNGPCPDPALLFFLMYPFPADQGGCRDHSTPCDNLPFQTFVSSCLSCLPFTFPHPFPALQHSFSPFPLQLPLLGVSL
jgi:hypothetical protein